MNLNRMGPYILAHAPGPVAMPFGLLQLYSQPTASSMADESDEVEWDGWPTFSSCFYACIASREPFYPP